MAGAEFTLTSEQFPLMARLAGEGAQGLSPWSQVAPASVFGAEQWKQLEQAGLCAGAGQQPDQPGPSTGVGQLRDEVLATIQELRAPSRFVRLRLMSGPTMMEHMIYFAGAQERPISFTSVKGGVLVRNPAPLRTIFQALAEYWGHSRLVCNRLRLRLTREEALVLAAITDMHRRQLLADRAAMRPAEARFYSGVEVQEALQRTPRDGQWLVATLRAFTGYAADLAVAAVEAALARLAQEQVVAVQEGRFGLADEGLAFANNFLLISQVLRLEIGSQMDGDEVLRSGMLCLQAGLHENLYLDREDGLVVLETVPALFICEMMETFLKESFTAEELAEPAAAASGLGMEG